MKNALTILDEAFDRATLLSILMTSILISLLSLAIPIAAQTLINFIAFGGLIQPVLTLSVIVFVSMMALGALYLWQTIVVEIIQQKLMVNVSLNLTQRLTELSFDAFSTRHGPELVNRFFEIVTIKKSIASLLLYGINLALQLMFGLLLLLFYHPLFIVFDGFIVLSVLLIVCIPHRRGLETAEEECFQKHQIGAWLEELLIHRRLFRFHLYHDYAIEQADKRLVSFLKGRNRHFKQLLTHQIGFYSLSAIAGSLLLGMGGYLVIHNQLSLGQLVAAEMVLGALIYAFKRFEVLLENYYDLKASQSKIELVLQLPIDEHAENIEPLMMPMTSIELKTPDRMTGVLSYQNPLVMCASPDECQSFTDALLGFGPSNGLQVWINQLTLPDTHRELLRRHTLLIGRPQWFTGTIYDNLVLNNSNVSDELLIATLKKAHLLDTIMCQPHGLKTVIYEWNRVFTECELIELMMVRAWLAQPSLLVIDRALDFLKQSAVDAWVAQWLTSNKTLVLIISQHPDSIPLLNRWVRSL